MKIVKIVHSATFVYLFAHDEVVAMSFPIKCNAIMCHDAIIQNALLSQFELESIYFIQKWQLNQEDFGGIIANYTIDVQILVHLT